MQAAEGRRHSQQPPQRFSAPGVLCDLAFCLPGPEGRGGELKAFGGRFCFLGPSGVPRDYQLESTYLQAVTVCKMGLFDTLAVDEGAIGALEVSDLELPVRQRRQAAVHP
jgi:hypothetical protein